jgi:thymidylate kinase
MFTVALLGPDGAGKSTIGRKLEKISPLPLKYLYMGVNLESSNLVLPTTRLLLEVKRAWGRRPDMTTVERTSPVSRGSPKSFARQLAGGLKSAARLANLTAEEWFRQFVIWYYTLRGYYVILDRHFYFDYYAHDVANPNPDRPLTSRLHGFMLRRLYPKPDFVIFLDAPSEVLFARKPEGTLNALETRRQEYVRLRSVVKDCAVVDVSRPTEEVVREVSDLIMKFHSSKIGKK